MKKIVLVGLILISVLGIKAQTQINSSGSYVWNASDEPKTFNYKLQLSFVNSNTGFPSYGTVLAGGGIHTGEDGGAFQLYFPYNEQYGGNAPKIRLGKYKNQGWSNWETFYTSANANKSSIDWNVKNLYTSGRIGIGTSDISNPITIQKVSGGTGYSNSDGNGGVRIRWSTGYGVALDAWDGGTPRWGITKYTQNIPTVMIEGRHNSNDVLFNSGGSVGIGTTDTEGYKLAVAGKMVAEEVVVALQGDWADFVFKKDYKLRDLEEVENFIEENNHLPDIPSEKEVVENGVALGEMDAKLLQKIEELTLYMIEQNKKTNELIEEVQGLKSENEMLKEKITKLETAE